MTLCHSQLAIYVWVWGGHNCLWHWNGCLAVVYCVWWLCILIAVYCMCVVHTVVLVHCVFIDVTLLFRSWVFDMSSWTLPIWWRYWYDNIVRLALFVWWLHYSAAILWSKVLWSLLSLDTDCIRFYSMAPPKFPDQKRHWSLWRDYSSEWTITMNTVIRKGLQQWINSYHEYSQLEGTITMNMIDVASYYLSIICHPMQCHSHDIGISLGKRQTFVFGDRGANQKMNMKRFIQSSQI